MWNRYASPNTRYQSSIIPNTFAFGKFAILLRLILTCFGCRCLHKRDIVQMPKMKLHEGRTEYKVTWRGHRLYGVWRLYMGVYNG